MLTQFQEKYKHPSIITPKKHFEYLQKIGKMADFPPPPKLVILCYQSIFLKKTLATYKMEVGEGPFEKLHFFSESPGLAIGDAGIGAPRAAARLEKYIACGVSQFLSLGTAGSLQPHVKIGDIVLCNRAVRGEGISGHYLPPGYDVSPPGALTNRYEQALSKTPFLKGATWTTDAFYRQTEAEIRHFQKEGVLSVEMEAAALFAVAHFHHVQLATAFAISDSLASLEWEPQLHSDATYETLDRLLEVSLHLGQESES